MAFSQMNLFSANKILHYKLIVFCSVIAVSSCSKDELSNADVINANNKPNIILILADDIGYEVPTYTGGQSYVTTSIDNLAQTGVQFTGCNVCPNCVPTRIELLTGKYGFRNYTGWGILDPAQKTVANMLQDAGYKTCVAGKWQLGGGDASIRGFGFDKYLVFEPFYTNDEENENKYRYKNPRLYQNGNYLLKAQTKNKYADDMFVDYISKFIDSNKRSPFFIYYPLSLCHMPFSPTPDDAAYNNWDPVTDGSRPSYFPSMVHYMDKKVQQVIDKVKSSGLSDNTIIIFLSDNGTAKNIYYSYKGNILNGGKGSSSIYGTHVPLIISFPGSISPHQISEGLIDAVDFLPTIADMANIQKPLNFGTLDGISFYPLLSGSHQRLRDWIYFWWHPQQIEKPVFRVWVQNETYKLYDSTNHNFFINTIVDPWELNPIPYNQLTPIETAWKNIFDTVLLNMH